MMMAEINFFEIYRMGRLMKLKSYFQPKLILKGMSVCSCSYPEYKTSISQLRKCLIEEKNVPNYLSIQNSPLNVMCEILDDHSRSSATDIVNFLFSMFGINKHNNFLYDFNETSLLQKGLDDNDMTKPVQELYEHIVINLKDARYSEVLWQDLPQLLGQDKIDIFDFVSKSKNEEDAQLKDLDHEDCNMENKLKNTELPFLGPVDICSREFCDFTNYFDLREEMEQKTIDDTHNPKALPEGSFAGNHPGWLKFKNLKALFGGESNKRIEVEHNFMNFTPMIRKLKIDMHLGRKASKAKYTLFMDWFDIVKTHPSEFNEAPEILLTQLLMLQKDNREFYE